MISVDIKIYFSNEQRGVYLKHTQHFNHIQHTNQSLTVYMCSRRPFHPPLYFKAAWKLRMTPYTMVVFVSYTARKEWRTYLRVEDWGGRRCLLSSLAFRIAMSSSLECQCPNHRHRWLKKAKCKSRTEEIKKRKRERRWRWLLDIICHHTFILLELKLT